MKYLFGIILIVLNSCGSGGEYKNDSAEMTEPLMSKSTMSMRSDITPARNQSTVGQKIIRNANMDIQVEDIESSFTSIESIIKGFDAYISNQNQYNNPGSSDFNITIRIKESQLDSLMKLCEKESIYLRSKSINSRDVTEEYIDVETRIRTKKAVETKYMELLSRAKTLSEILQVEEKLRVIREEIESVEGRMNYLNNQISYSTLNLHLYQVVEEINQEPGKSFISRVKESLVRGWAGFKSFILFIFYLWPFIFIAPIIIYFVRRYRRKRRSVNE